MLDAVGREGPPHVTRKFDHIVSFERWTKEMREWCVERFGDAAYGTTGFNGDMVFNGAGRWFLFDGKAHFEFGEHAFEFKMRWGATK
ncbi:MAG: hypothetical protein EOP83_05915 [Verrucomicrobiaceae bacterium]|nr:MAG: hypothetical protein EOP83_05915 [Verrucomicrobiaceae bacterium]